MDQIPGNTKVEFDNLGLWPEHLLTGRDELRSKLATQAYVRPWFWPCAVSSFCLSSPQDHTRYYSSVRKPDLVCLKLIITLFGNIFWHLSVHWKPNCINHHGWKFWLMCKLQNEATLDYQAFNLDESLTRSLHKEFPLVRIRQIENPIRHLSLIVAKLLMISLLS